MSPSFALAGCRIFDGTTFLEDAALVVADGKVAQIVGNDAVPADTPVEHLDGGTLMPGFIDLQVNGGGGCQFNDNPTVEAIEAICDVHGQMGTTSLLPTLITDGAEKTAAAIHAAKKAQESKVPGFLGLHLEGPHLSQARKGAHDPGLIRKMEDQDLQLLLQAAADIDNLMITVAPESVRPDQIGQLSNAGAIISLGHSNTDYGTAMEAAEAGASCVTHLFNAMSPLTHREPGLVGAALQSGKLYCGLIADGFHVDAAAIRIALAAKNGPGRIFLVSDAMAATGSDRQEFELGGRKILRNGGRLTLEDGTLAGADIDMAGSLKFMVHSVGTEFAEAAKMATLYPAQCLGRQGQIGQLSPGLPADLVHLDDALSVQRVWRGGSPLAARR
ncbi:MAG: N-acetylglucosamine-6-phosphate deacetylase [Rhizobiaceae bacterium]